LNYLAHLFLSDSCDDALIGGLLGDFVKGNPAGRYNGIMAQSILLHRKVDTFADAHPVTRTSRSRIDGSRRRFAGVIIDVCYDHFLARHWQRFSGQALAAFTSRVYTVLNRQRAILPSRLKRILPVMVAEDWLGGYARIDRVAVTLDRIAGRLSKGSHFKGAIADIHANYAALEADFFAFFPDLVDFCDERHRKVGYRTDV
jgi:acyl carrier protein phosphodiesterase